MHAAFFVSVVVWLQVWTIVAGYPTGAPEDRCLNMTPGHNVLAQAGSSPYSIMISNKTFGTNQTIKVMIHGPAYLGLLLQARTGSGTNAVGTWGAPPNDTKYLQCSGIPQSAITHANRNSKSGENVYTWIPPDNIASAFITATVVANRTTFWVNLRSDTLSRAPGEGSSAAADFKMAITPVLFLTLLMSTVFQSFVNAPSVTSP